MGWATGSELLTEVARRMNKNTKLSDRVREQVYTILLDELENLDCDTLYEARGVDHVLDTLLELRFPEEESYEEEYEDEESEDVEDE